MAGGSSNKKSGKSLKRKLFPKLGVIKKKQTISTPTNLTTITPNFATTSGSIASTGTLYTLYNTLAQRGISPIYLSIEFNKEPGADSAGRLSIWQNSVPSLSGASQTILGTGTNLIQSATLTYYTTSVYLFFGLEAMGAASATTVATRIRVFDLNTNSYIGNSFLINAIIL